MATFKPPSSDQSVIDPVKHWIETLVVGLNLCPFARKALLDNRVRFVVAWTERREELLQSLVEEITFLQNTPEVQTTLLIHPRALLSFDAYNKFLGMVDEALVQFKYEGEFQVASFHPRYQFEDTQPEDAENFTNRSPFPILHILREDDVTRAIESTPDVHLVPERNIAKLNAMGSEKLLDLLESCFHGVDTIDASVSIYKRDWD